MSHSDNCEASALPAEGVAPVLHIRVMRPADRPALVDLWVASWRDTMPMIDFDARRSWIESVLAAPANTTLVVEAAGLSCGFASMEGHILHQFVVAPAGKGGRIADALMAAVKGAVPGGLDLEVNEANARAIRFYRRHGFQQTGTGRNVTSGLATWHMRWRPKPDPSPLRRA